MSPILGIDLRKFKSLACCYDPTTIGASSAP